MRKLQRRWREVALVRDADQLRAASERKQQLGCVRDELTMRMR